jgi:hypothetical protein
MLEQSLIKITIELIQSLIVTQIAHLFDHSLKAFESLVHPGFHKELQISRSETTWKETERFATND